MKAVAVIPARGGSKRIPGKNIKNFLGAPLITYPIKALKSTGLFGEVYVSTDSEEIASLAEDAGACVPFLRTSGLSGDYVSTLDVIKDAILNLDNLSDSTLLICAYPAAILDVTTWTNFVNQSGSNDPNFTVAVGRMRNAPERALVRALDGSMQMAKPDFAATRTQDLPESFYDAGKAYGASVGVWKNATTILGTPFNAFELHFSAAQDLDTLEDWSFAESLLRDRL